MLFKNAPLIFKASIRDRKKVYLLNLLQHHSLLVSILQLISYFCIKVNFSPLYNYERY